MTRAAFGKRSTRKPDKVVNTAMEVVPFSRGI